MRTLRTPLCSLEPQVVAHANEMFAVLCDPAIYEFEGEPPPSIERLAEGFRRKQSRLSPDGAERWLNWVVRLPNGHLAGYVQATVLQTGASYIGYEFASRYWRQGLGTASVGAMLDELASAYQVHTFVAVLKAANHRSTGMLAKLAFSPCPAEQAAEFESEVDEIILVKSAAQHLAQRPTRAV
jgi:[ribosomal protein S5]-alanine N-acetyltransferase